jgi:hypothetical protein
MLALLVQLGLQNDEIELVLLRCELTVLQTAVAQHLACALCFL